MRSAQEVQRAHLTRQLRAQIAGTKIKRQHSPVMFTGFEVSFGMLILFSVVNKLVNDYMTNFYYSRILILNHMASKIKILQQ